MDDETTTQKDSLQSKPMNKHAPPIRKLQKDFATTCHETEEEALKEVAKRVKEYSDDLIEKWNKEIDNLLVFAGLFSSVLTGFNVQSYLLLQPSTPDPILVVLQQISLQLNSFSVNPPGALVNSTHPVIFSAVQSSPVEPWAVWLNSLWFSALICSLSASAVAILVKQWVHILKYEDGISSDSLEFARLRQYRLNHWKKWHVPEIIAFLPTLLQISLFLFFAGILILLWHYHSVVAIVASTLIGAIALFVVGTTILPIFCADCCYLSPPVYPLYTLRQSAKYTIIWLCDIFLKGILICCDYMESLSSKRPTVSRPNPTIVSTLRQWAFVTGFSTHIPLTLRDRDRNFTLGSSAELDVDMLAYAYATATVDPRNLFNTAWAIFSSGRVYVGSYVSNNFYKRIKKANAEHFRAPYSRHSTTPDICAGELVYSRAEDSFSWGESPRAEHSRAEHSNAIDFLFNERSRYYPGLKPVTCQRLLLALVATLTKQNPMHAATTTPGVDAKLSPEWDGYTKSLTLLEELFTLQPAPLALVPWSAVSHVIAAAEFSLCRLLPNALDLETERDTHDLHRDVVLQWLRILVRCCLAPFNSWERSPEQMHALVEYLPKFANLVRNNEALLLNLWEEIFSFKSDALNDISMPWDLLEPVVKLAEDRMLKKSAAAHISSTESDQQLVQSDQPPIESSQIESSQQLIELRNTVLTFQSLRIWIWCRFMPVFSWKESQFMMDKSAFSIKGLGILDQEALINIAKNLGDWPNPDMIIQTLRLLLLYMSCSEVTRDGPWRLVPDDFLDSVENVIEVGRRWSTADAVTNTRTRSMTAAVELIHRQYVLQAAVKERDEAKSNLAKKEAEAAGAANSMMMMENGIQAPTAQVKETEKRIGEAEKAVETAKANVNAATAARMTANAWYPLHDELEELADQLAKCKELQSRQPSDLAICSVT